MIDQNKARNRGIVLALIIVMVYMLLIASSAGMLK